MHESQRLGRTKAGWQAATQAPVTRHEAAKRSPRDAKTTGSTPRCASTGHKKVRNSPQSARPGQPIQQRLNALERANAVRFGRAEIKRQVGKGERRLVDVIENPPDCMLRVPVFELIQWGPQIGKQTARRLIRELLTETLPLECMGERTRRKLIARLTRKPQIAVPG